VTDSRTVARRGSPLTHREREVLLAIWEADGDIPAAAARLGISPKTARTHVEHACSRLGVRKTLAAIRRVLHT